MTTSLAMGDMFACKKCAAQIQVVKDCDCEAGCAELKCCGQDMENITEPTIRSDGDTDIGDGMELK